MILFLLTDQLIYAGLGAALGTIFADGVISFTSRSLEHEDSKDET
ncbi:MAG: hypothetical protein BAJATHORv1_40329 [Candidatus Thorarchaeota archaeon]|nr:MAG: hypothetical protein BAJATHORv1_40329 [Candidatus Thorarchaeota archaeon]